MTPRFEDLRRTIRDIARDYATADPHRATEYMRDADAFPKVVGRSDAEFQGASAKALELVRRWARRLTEV